MTDHDRCCSVFLVGRPRVDGSVSLPSNRYFGRSPCFYAHSMLFSTATEAELRVVCRALCSGRIAEVKDFNGSEWLVHSTI